MALALLILLLVLPAALEGGTIQIRMSQRVENEPAYVLHRRPYRETSLLLDVFSLNHGRAGLVARGAKRPRNPWKAQLQPFQPLVLTWQGKGDLKTLTDAESRPAPPLAGQSRLYCGFYLNELLQRLLPEHEPVPELFAAYLDALDVLQTGENIELGLRDFEQQLITTLGYGFKWDWATDLDSTVRPDHEYAFDPQQGIIAVPGPGTLMRGLSGCTLLSLAAGVADSPESRRLSKRVMRRLIDFLLQGRPLQSRRLFTDARGDSDDP